MEKYAIKFPTGLYLGDDGCQHSHDFAMVFDSPDVAFIHLMNVGLFFHDFIVVHATKLCAWCGKVETWGELEEPVSHGMCDECLAKQKRELEEK